MFQTISKLISKFIRTYEQCVRKFQIKISNTLLHFTAERLTLHTILILLSECYKSLNFYCVTFCIFLYLQDCKENIIGNKQNKITYGDALSPVELLRSKADTRIPMQKHVHAPVRIIRSNQCRELYNAFLMLCKAIRNPRATPLLTRKSTSRCIACWSYFHLRLLNFLRFSVPNSEQLFPMHVTAARF